jgi:hypothetical protein
MVMGVDTTYRAFEDLQHYIRQEPYNEAKSFYCEEAVAKAKYAPNADEVFSDRYAKLPIEIDEFYSFLSNAVSQFNTFDLLANVSYYNSLHNMEEYSDYRGDRHFFASEVLALLCLKNNFVVDTAVPQNEFPDFFKKVQETILHYCGRNDALENFNSLKSRDTLSEISNSLVREAKMVRNPAFPEHHYIFSEKLFEPIEKERYKLVGFSIKDSLVLDKEEILEYIVAGDFARYIIKNISENKVEN